MTSLKTLPALLAVGGSALMAPSTAALAAPQTVVSGALRWHQTNVFDSSAPAGTARTWLGYVTASTSPFASANGTLAVQAPATGIDVTPTSPRGLDRTYVQAYPAVADGTYDPATGAGRVEFRGTVSFTSAAHRFAITVEDPLVVLDGGKGQFFASGAGSSGSGQNAQAGARYDRSKPVFDLAVGAARATTSTDGTRTLNGVAPAIATADLVWPGGNYPVGAGPDRTPNTFGSFDLVLRTAIAAPRISCRPTRTRAGRARTTCTVRVDDEARRISVLRGGRRVTSTTVRDGVARLSLPRARRKLKFVALDAAGRRLATVTRTVGG